MDLKFADFLITDNKIMTGIDTFLRGNEFSNGTTYKLLANKSLSSIENGDVLLKLSCPLIGLIALSIITIVLLCINLCYREYIIKPKIQSYEKQVAADSAYTNSENDAKASIAKINKALELIEDDFKNPAKIKMSDAIYDQYFEVLTTGDSNAKERALRCLDRYVNQDGSKRVISLMAY